MSQVARVFVVLNLLVAAGFLFASATFLSLNSDFKGQLEKEVKAHQLDNDANESRISEKDAEIARLGGENSGLREQRGQNEAKITAQDSEIARLTAENTAKDTQIANLTRVNEVHATAVTGLRADLDTQLKRAEAARDEARAKTEETSEAVKKLEMAQAEIVTLTNDLHTGEKTITSQKEMISNLSMMKEYAQKTLGVSFDNVLVMPSLNGVVAQTDGRSLVQVNLGTEQGMGKGFTVDVVRGGSYVGRVRIDTVFANSSAGQVTILAPGETVRVGDRVYTNLQ
jgi:hypothetical protein